MQSLQELKTDMEKVRDRLASLEKYADLKTDLDKFQADFNKFLKNYEKEMTTVKIKQGMIYSGLAFVVSVVISIISDVFGK